MGKKSRALRISDVTRQSAKSGKVGPILTSFQHAPLDPSSLASCPSLSLAVHSWTR